MDSKGRTMRTRKRAREEKGKEEEKPEENKILEGLTVVDNYVVVDENLLKRLKPIEPDTPSPPPDLKTVFTDCPEYVDLLKHGKSLTPDFIAECQAQPKDKIGEMVATLPLEWLALKHTNMMTHDYEYRYKPNIQPRVTNQFHSGRCWMFASLNVLRYAFIPKMNLEHKFEFSGAYLFFWDKIERSNLFLEGTWALSKSRLDDRYLDIFINPGQHLTQDGGYWQYFKNLVTKYGLVPKSVYNDSYNCMVSDYMNETLTAVLNQMALEIRSSSIVTRKQFDAVKDECMKKIYDLVVRFMGEPPKQFNWKYKDNEGHFHEIKDLTPTKFFNVLVLHNMETKMTFIHDPRYPEHYYKPYHIEYGTNMVGGDTVVFINLPLDVFKRAIAESQINGEPVWFACDVTASMDSEAGVMDTERFDYESVLGIKTRYDKVDMMKMRTTAPTHAMVINGVDMDEPENNKPYLYSKWRVDNSWGINTELEWHPDEGCWQMSDKWFDQHVFMAVIDLKYFEPDSLQKIMENGHEKVVIKPWDVFGCVAMHAGCTKCKSRVPHGKNPIT